MFHSANRVTHISRSLLDDSGSAASTRPSDQALIQIKGSTNVDTQESRTSRGQRSTWAHKQLIDGEWAHSHYHDRVIVHLIGQILTQCLSKVIASSISSGSGSSGLLDEMDCAVIDPEDSRSIVTRGIQMIRLVFETTPSRPLNWVCKEMSWWKASINKLIRPR